MDAGIVGGLESARSTENNPDRQNEEEVVSFDRRESIPL